MTNMTSSTEPFKVKQKLQNQATQLLVLVRSKPHPIKQLCGKQFVRKVLQHHPQTLNLMQMQYFLILLRQISNTSVESDFLTFQHTGRAAAHYPLSGRHAVSEILCVHLDEKSKGFYKYQTCASAPVAAIYLYI